MNQPSCCGKHVAQGIGLCQARQSAQPMLVAQKLVQILHHMPVECTLLKAG